MADQDDLIISISTDVATLRRSNKKLEAAMGETLDKIQSITIGAGAKMDASFAKTGKSMAASLRKVETASQQVNRAGLNASVAFAKFFALLGTAKGFQELVDSSTRMTNSLKVAGLSGDDLSATLDKLYTSALRNHAPIESLTTLYSRAALQQKELGASSDKLVTFTDTVGKALRVSGTSASEAEGSLLQLGQALGSGTVHAEEFNSILEGMPALAQAAAKGIKQANGSVAELKNLVINQQLSSRALFDGIIAGADDLDTKLQGSSTTIGQAFIDLKTSLTRAVSDLDKASGSAEKVASAIEAIANGLANLKFDNTIAGIKGIIDYLDTAANKAGRLWEKLTNVATALNNGTPLTDLAPPGNTEAEIRKLYDQHLSAGKEQIAVAEKLNDLERQRAEIISQYGKDNPIGNRMLKSVEGQISDIQDATTKGKDELAPAQTKSTFHKVHGHATPTMPAAEVDPIDITDPKYAANSTQNAQKLQKAYEDLLRTAKDRNDQLQQEIDLVDKSGLALDTARYKLELLQKAQKDGITGDNLKNIQAQADAYTRLSETLAKAKLGQDLADKAHLRTLSPQEQQVSTQLRQYGLADDPTSPQAAQIRKSLQIDSADDTVKGFLTSFRDGVVSNGGNIGKALGDAVKTSFLNALTKASDEAISPGVSFIHHFVRRAA